MGPAQTGISDNCVFTGSHGIFTFFRMFSIVAFCAYPTFSAFCFRVGIHIFKRAQQSFFSEHALFFYAIESA
jgi:hypothetical protein